MAIWHFSFHLIPKIKYNMIKDISSTEDIVDYVNWEEYKICEESLKDISLLLKPTKSYSDDIKQFGSLEGTCIELSYSYNSLDCIQVRLDLTSITKQLIKDILHFSQVNNSLIVTDKKVIELNIDDLIKEIKESRSFLFVKNPIDFLRSI